MTREEKAQIALRELKETIPEAISVKHIGVWRGNDVFEDSSEYPEGTMFIGPSGFVTVSEDGIANTLSIYEVSAPDFPG
jgi:hypothetical protein